MVQSLLPQYCESTDKAAKSRLVSSIVDSIRSRGNFVKFEEDSLVAVSDRFAREKVGQQFRDLLSHKYRSSTKAKSRARTTPLQPNLEQQQVPVPDQAGSAASQPITGAATAMLSNFMNSEANATSNTLFSHNDKSLAAQLDFQPLAVSSMPQWPTRCSEKDLSTKPQTSLSNMAALKPLFPTVESRAILSDLEPTTMDLRSQSAIFSVNAFLW